MFSKVKGWILRSADGFGIKVPMYLAIMLALLVGLIFGGVALIRSLTYTPPRWVTTTATIGTVEQVVTVLGTVEKSNQAAISFPIDAEVVEVYAALGDEVVAGQPIARIATAELQQALDTARATYERAKYSLSQLESARDMSAALQSADSATESDAQPMDIAEAMVEMQRLAENMATTQQAAETAYLQLSTECGWLIEQLPSELPSELPTQLPSGLPTQLPSGLPTQLPTSFPTQLPTDLPDVLASLLPTDVISQLPSGSPTPSTTTVPTESSPDVVGDLGFCLSLIGDLASAGVELIDAQLEAMTLMSSVMESMQGALAAAMGGVDVNEVTIAAARVAVSGAERSLQQAELDVESATIRTPITGILAQLPFTVGERAGSAATAIIIGSGTVTLTLSVPLAQIPLIFPGQSAAISQVGAAEVPGVVSAKALLPATATSTDYQVVVSSLEAANALREGARATVQIRTAISERVVTVPVSAVRILGEGDAAEVLVLTGDVAEVRAVRYSTIGGGRVALTSGLAADETVILADAYKPLPDLMEEIQQMQRASRNSGR
ncbi:MAG: biotin/lipoyl-binding protein [Propionibacteriaceae bacterium]|nr:biotin/lipoyl-binding protein [Propionibacteriaceae bacterium]